MKKRFITAYMWSWDCSKKEAEKAYARMDDERRRLTIQAFEETIKVLDKNAKRVFHYD